MIPTNLKQAMENDNWVVKSIYYKGGKILRVDFQRRFSEREGVNFVSFWINRNYFERKYPKTFERFVF